MQPAGNQIDHEERQDLLTAHQQEQYGQQPVVDLAAAKAKKKKIVIISLSIVIAIGVLLAIVLPLSLRNKDTPAPPPPPAPPLGPPDPFNWQEFNPYHKVEKVLSDSDWSASGIATVPIKLDNLFSSLRATNEEEEDHRKPGAYYKPVDPGRIGYDSPNNGMAIEVGYQFTLVDNYQARIRIFDSKAKDSYQVSDDVFPRPVESFEARLSQVGFQLNLEPFSFSLGNIYNNETLVSTELRKLIVAEKYSEIGFRLPTKRIYGLGQHNSQFHLTNGTYTLWSKGNDGPLPFDNANGGVSGNHIHPFVLCQTQHKDFFGIFFVATTSQAFEVVYFNNYTEPVLNYITLGGELEMYVIMRGTADEIIKKYHALIGYSQMPPYYALGFYQGSNYYDSEEDLNKVIDGYNNEGINLEGIHVEKYFDKAKVFSTDKIPNLKAVTTKLAQQKQKLIISLGSGITNDKEYKYRKADYEKYFIKSSMTESQLIGEQDGEKTVFPDFFNPEISKLYTDGLTDLGTQIGEIDGIVFKDLEFASDIDGEFKPEKASRRYLNQTLPDSQHNEEEVGQNETYKIFKDQNTPSYYYLPLIPGFTQSGYLDTNTISPNATHYGYDKEKKPKDSIEFYLHNANGHMGMKTLKAVTEQLGGARRGMIYSESTWAGSGANGAALITNLFRSWDNLKSTISMAMGLGMYGFSNIVTDVCGTIGPLDEELCGRWMQLAAFLPMARNYYAGTYKNDKNESVPTEPSEFYKLTGDAKYMASTSILQKLAYSRYTYSQMYKIYRDGGSIVRPLFFEFPHDDHCFFDNVTDTTFMLGDAIKVSPVLTSKIETFPSYFPKGEWVDLNAYVEKVSSDGKFVDLVANSTSANIHLMPGKIIPFQEPAKVGKTNDFESKPITFLINRDDSQYAEGFILVDDGISKNSYADEQYTFWKIRFAERSINFWVHYGNYSYNVPSGMQIDKMEEIKILQAEDLADIDFACYFDTSITPKPLDVSYNSYFKYLSIKPADGEPVRYNDLGAIRFGNSKKEINFCDPNAFSYKIDTVANTTHNKTIRLVNKQNEELNEALIFIVQLMDDEGTIRVAITTESDHKSGNKQKFRPEMVVTDNKQYRLDKISKKLDDFFTYSSDPFSYEIFEEGRTDKVLYRSNPNKLFISDYFVLDEGIFSLNAKTGFPLMGMGERAGSIFYKDEQGGIHSRYTFDQANPIDDGLPPGRNMYGVQPLYIYQEKYENYFGVFNLNPYAQDFILYFNEGVDTSITNIMIGGIINKFFFRGQKPDDVIVKYQRLVGNPTATPLWSFGWQQSRFGYVTEKKWWEAYTNYTTIDFPLDTMWADIDYMDDYKIFTISETRYPNLAKYVDQLHAANVTFVPIMDAGVAVRSDDYLAYKKGLEMGIFIKQAENENPLTAGVWCGNAHFPDLFTDNGVQYWYQMLDHLYTNLSLKFDGIWLDENEATNFCNGYCIPSERPKNARRNKPFWIPGSRDLEDKALGLDGRHGNGWTEYDLHNLFALTQSRATYNYLANLDLNPYVLTRSSFPGIGQFAHHWLADNWSTDEYLKLSVSGLYSYQFFGMPFIGSDICGFNSYETKIESIANVCTKWHVLGSLYPFARNHNQNATLPHEPFQFDFAYNTSSTYLDVIKEAISVRYNYIRYYYSAFQSIEEVGGSFFKPAFFDYPNDPLSYVDVENNIFLGHALKASILVNTTEDLKPGQTSEFYFPPGQYCQLYPPTDKDNANYCFESLADNATDSQVETRNKQLRTQLEDYYIHLRSGNVLPYQEAKNNKVKTTKNLADLPVDLFVLPTKETKPVVMNAAGYIYLDDGIQHAKSVPKFEFLVTLGSDTLDFTVMQTKAGTKRNAQEENLGVIKMFWASRLGLDKLTTLESVFYALDTEGKMKKIRTLDPVTYDDKQDVLLIPATYKNDKDEKVNLSFYDFGAHGYIKLEPKITPPPTPTQA